MLETTNNPVSQVLMNDDLLYIILKRSHTDLARLARVCRSLHGPAVDVLWNDLATITPPWNLLAPPQRQSYHYRTVYGEIANYLSSVSQIQQIE